MSGTIGGRQAAHLLGVHENTVRNWTKTGLLTDVRIPGTGHARYDMAEVERLVENRQRPAEPPALAALAALPEHTVLVGVHRTLGKPCPFQIITRHVGGQALRYLEDRFGGYLLDTEDNDLAALDRRFRDLRVVYAPEED